MSLPWITAPFHGRLHISELVLEQWSWLRDAGWIDNAVIVADDDNLDLAEEFDFVGVECSNEFMGRRWNVGFRTALAFGAPAIVYCGSDNWVHHSVFWDDAIAGRLIDFVDMERGVLQHARLRDFHGAIPWVIPAGYFSGDPMPDEMQLGSETMLYHGLGRPPWSFRTETFAPCVDFKVAETRTPYAGVANSIGDGVEHDAAVALSANWPTELVRKAVDRFGAVRNG